MRVLIWSSGYPPALGGVETVVRGLARGLAERGHTIEVITQSPHEEPTSGPEAEGIVHRLPFHQVLASRDLSRFARLAARLALIQGDFAPEVVHVHAVHPSEIFLLLSPELAACPLAFTLHGWTEMASGSQTLRERMLHRADRVIGCSRHVIEQARREVPGIAPSSGVIYNGRCDPEIAREPLPFGPPRILCAGRMVEHKGFDRVLRAMPEVLRHLPQARLSLVGDGPYRPDLEKECDRLGLRRSTDFVGRVSTSSVFTQMNAATVVVVPSHGGSEGLPMVALEAALMERPVLATRDGGLPEVVVDAETGVLVESCEPEVIARALVSVLGDPGLAIRLGQAARRRALEKFSMQGHLSQYAGLLESLTRRSAR